MILHTLMTYIQYKSLKCVIFSYKFLLNYNLYNPKLLLLPSYLVIILRDKTVAKAILDYINYMNF